MLKPLYIIPARGGSKGIPHKNIKPLGGRPLIAYTIDVALELCDDLRRIVLSTDDPAIADTARSLGLPVEYMRPAALATDTAGSREVMLDVMDMADAEGIAYDAVVLLQPTSPLRTAADVEAAMALYTPETDMVVSVEPASCNPYYNCFETSADGSLRISKGDGMLTRRQDAPAAWTFNGAVYVINPASLRAMPMGAFPRRIPSPMPPERSIDLDTPRDWVVAEAIMSTLKPSATL
ncbi:MAG: acylneuraminate cytidylyltransferase family protein [Muribaculaceae bacterium]|nr:acylneuraminate cytidylyltransferase family protein [Muribaculaceae bacterium]MDE6487291.1 acylneuraminate cytidylyltransferase family protein [Muribaculaceae bacterium]